MDRRTEDVIFWALLPQALRNQAAVAAIPLFIVFGILALLWSLMGWWTIPALAVALYLLGRWLAARDAARRLREWREWRILKKPTFGPPDRALRGEVIGPERGLVAWKGDRPQPSRPREHRDQSPGAPRRRVEPTLSPPTTP